MSNMQNCKKCHAKTILLVIAFMLVVVGLVGYFGFYTHMPVKTVALTTKKINIDGVYLPTTIAINEFNMTDNHGKPFTQNNLKGKWTMMFFGFTNCGYVCPTTLAELNKMYKKMQKSVPQDQLPQIVFVSVDPERDTVAKMNQYIKSFNAHFIGIRADLAETQKLEKQLHITAVKMQVEGEDKTHYSVDHSSEILLINPDGEVRAYLSFPHKADALITDFNIVKNA